MHGSFMYVLVKAVHNITQQYLRLDFLTFQIYIPMRCNFIGRLVLGFVVTFAIFITLIALTHNNHTITAVTLMFALCGAHP